MMYRRGGWGWARAKRGLKRRVGSRCNLKSGVSGCGWCVRAGGSEGLGTVYWELQRDSEDHVTQGCAKASRRLTALPPLRLRQHRRRQLAERCVVGALLGQQQLLRALALRQRWRQLFRAGRSLCTGRAQSLL